LHFSDDFIEVLKYISHICKFSNPTIILMVFMQIMVSWPTN